MKKILCTLISCLLLMFGFVIFGNTNKVEASNNAYVDTLRINGQRYNEDNGDFKDITDKYLTEGWKFQSGTLYLNGYHGSSISFSMYDNLNSSLVVCIYGENTITTENDIVSGFSVKGAKTQYVDFIFQDAGASLTINSKADGINISSNDPFSTFGRFYNGSSDNTYDSYLYINAGHNGINCPRVNVRDSVNMYVFAEEFGVVLHENIAYQSNMFFEALGNSFVMIYGNKSASNRYPRHDYVFQPYAKKYYVDSLNNLLIMSNKEDIITKTLLFKDENPSHGFSQVERLEFKYGVGEEANFSFNCEQLTYELKYYINIAYEDAYNDLNIKKKYDFRINGSEEAILSGKVENEDAVSINCTFEEQNAYVLTNELVLCNGNQEISSVKHRYSIIPYDYHTVKLDESIKGVTLKKVEGYDFDSVKSGDSFIFDFELDNYYALPTDFKVYANGEEVNEIKAGRYQIPEVTRDTVISFSENPYPYAFVTFYVGNQTIGKTDQFYKKTDTITLPKYSDIEEYIPEGMVFDYWKVGNRKTKFQCSTDTNPVSFKFNDDERGFLRIEAHFQGVYNLTGIDGHFYSDEECTQEITQAASVAIGSGKYTYFKFDNEFDEVIDGKMLYSYVSSCDVNVDIWDNNGILFFEMPAGDVTITPVYKYVIDEITVEGVQLPIAGNELIENQEKAPEGVNYKVAAYSSWYEIIDEETRKYLITFGYGDPYVFKNNTQYEVEIRFTVTEDGDYLFDPNGYARDGAFQFNIDGLDASQYEVVEHEFANIYKRQYCVTLRFTSVSKYNIDITGGVVLSNGVEIDGAIEGQAILLSANIAEAGKVFDHWTITGIEVDEELLMNSRLELVMPANEITAEAVFIDAPYFQVTYDVNGGTGVMEDVKVYDGLCILDECVFEAPEHKHFKCWAIGDNEYDELTSVVIEENTVVKAIWEYDTFEITFDSNGGEGSKDSEIKEYNSNYVLPAANLFTAPANKEFKCYLVNDVEKNAGDTIVITEDTVIKAEWKDKEVTPEPTDEPSTDIDDDTDSKSDSKSETNNNDKKKGNNTGAVVGIIVAVIAGIAIIGVVVFIVIKKRK